MQVLTKHVENIHLVKVVHPIKHVGHLGLLVNSRTGDSILVTDFVGIVNHAMIQFCAFGTVQQTILVPL